MTPRKGLWWRITAIDDPRIIEDLCNVKLVAPRRRRGVSSRYPRFTKARSGAMKNGAHSYAPIGLPTPYAVVHENGPIVEGQENPCEVVELAGVRATARKSASGTSCGGERID
jgi:hypothetical protein